MADSLSLISLNFVTVDVFTSRRYKGNPLAIVEVPKTVILEQEAKQAIANEFNLSETVFLHEGNSESPERIIDIFIPTTEIPFAGHPTIGTICYLCQDKKSPDVTTDKLILRTKAGPIAASYSRTDKTATASIPHKVRIHRSAVHWQHVLNTQPTLSLNQDEESQQILKEWQHRDDGSDNAFPVVSIVNGMSFILIKFPQVENFLDQVEIGRPRIDPNVTTLDEGWSSTVIAPYYYAILPEREDEIMRIRTRFVMEAIGEDPATGSAASALGSYLALQKGEADGSYSYKIEQGVEMGRSSEINVKVTLDSSGKFVKEVLLSGTATPVMVGTLLV